MSSNNFCHQLTLARPFATFKTFRLVILVEKDDCKVVQENGEYRRIYDGHENVTEEGDPCLNWSEVEDAADLIGVDGVGDHNYCRGPGGSGKIYCYISQTKTDHCKVRTCGERTILNVKLKKYFLCSEHVNVIIDRATDNGREYKQLVPVR